MAFTTLQTRLLFPIGQMLSTAVEVQGSLALFERIFQYLDLEHEIVDAPGALALTPERISGRVALRDVSFRYEEPVELEPPVTNGDRATPELATRREWTLDGVSLEVEPGQLAAIVGPTGAGKTTISYLIPRLYDVSEGRVELDGHDVRELTLETLAGAVGMVTQETYLFHATVRDNLLYAKPDATQEELDAATRAAQIHERILELSDGYDTLVGERGYRMSGGEKQRLAIARVILKNPRVLILDEATSALDTGSERLVQAALEPLMEGRTTIAIAHRLSTILAADVIFVLDRGRHRRARDARRAHRARRPLLLALRQPVRRRARRGALRGRRRARGRRRRQHRLSLARRPAGDAGVRRSEARRRGPRR